MTDTNTKYAWLTAWSSDALTDAINDYELPDGIAVKGKVKFTTEQAADLIKFLSDTANFGQYGAELDFALFYKYEENPKNPKKPSLNGSIRPVYVKESSTSTRTRARRSL